MTVNITAWEGDILPKVPLVPHPAFLKAVGDAAIEFCEETLSWKEWLSAIDVVASDRDYTLSLPAGVAAYAQIEKVRRVLFKENGADNSQFAPLHPATEGEMDADLGIGWQFQTGASLSRFLLDEDDPTMLLLYPIPENASAGGLLVQIYAKPMETATVVPDFLFKRYRKAITNGALANLFGETAMPWANPQLQSYYADLFSNDCDNATVRAVKGPIEKADSVQFRRNWI